MDTRQSSIEAAWDNRELLKEASTQALVREIIDRLDEGSLRVAQPTADGWQVNEWVAPFSINVGILAARLDTVQPSCFRGIVVVPTTE